MKGDFDVLRSYDHLVSPKVLARFELFYGGKAKCVV